MPSTSSRKTRAAARHFRPGVVYAALPRLQDLRDDANHKAKCAQDIMARAEKEGRPTSNEENAAFDQFMAEHAQVEERIKEVTAHQERNERLQALVDRAREPAGRKTEPDKPGSANGDAPRVAATYKRGGKLRAFKGPNAEERAYRAGMWARAVLLKDQRAVRWCENNGVGKDIRNALGENVNTAGGALVPEEFSQAIIDLREEYGVARQNVQVIPMGRDTMLIPRRAGGVTIYPVGENPATAITQSQPSWNQVRLTAKKAGGLTLMSTEVNEDAIIDLADWLADEFAYAFSLFEDQCLFLGDGTSTYLGIRGLANFFTPTGGAGGGQLVGAVDAASGHDTFAEIDAGDLALVMSRLPAYARMNAKWYVSAVGMDMVFGRLMAGAGGNTIQNIQGGYGLSYMGYPVVISQVIATSTGDLSDLPMLYFGDMRKAVTMGDRRDVTVFVSEHRYMDTDQIGVRATERFDIVVHDVGDTTTGNAGPIVALIGE